MTVHFNEAPTNFRNYYTSMREAFSSRYITAVDRLEDNLNAELLLYKEIESKVEMYNKEFNIDLNKYEEFVNNRYTTGEFCKLVNKLFANSGDDYESTSELYNLKQLADYMKTLDEVEKEIQICQKMLALKLGQFNEILRVYYHEVHRKMILDGCGYALPGRCGWLVINRFKFERHKPALDYKATKEKEAALRAAGKRIYNKEEAEWCQLHGIEYKAEDKRVFQDLEYGYEIVILGSTLPNSSTWKFTPTTYISRKLWKKSYSEIIELANNDVNKICDLPLSIKIKLQLCLKVNKILYTKFIRNETQKPSIARKADR